MLCQVSRGDTVVMMNTGKEYTLDEIGVLAPGKVQVGQGLTAWCGRGWAGPASRWQSMSLTSLPPLPPASSQVDTLYCGEVGYLAAQIKSVQDARVGDTVTMKKQQAEEPLPGYQVSEGREGSRVCERECGRGLLLSLVVVPPSLRRESLSEASAVFLQINFPLLLIHRTSSPWSTVVCSQSTLTTTRYAASGNRTLEALHVGHSRLLQHGRQHSPH
jgi:hypothetical protein